MTRYDMPRWYDVACKIFLYFPEERAMDAYNTAAGWPRPYNAVQWAWVRALGVEPSEQWTDGRTRKRRRKPTKREVRDAMGQRYGVRGL